MNNNVSTGSHPRNFRTEILLYNMAISLGAVFLAYVYWLVTDSSGYFLLVILRVYSLHPAVLLIMSVVSLIRKVWLNKAGYAFEYLASAVVVLPLFMSCIFMMGFLSALMQG